MKSDILFNAAFASIYFGIGMGLMGMITGNVAYFPIIVITSCIAAATSIAAVTKSEIDSYKMR